MIYTFENVDTGEIREVEMSMKNYQPYKGADGNDSTDASGNVVSLCDTMIAGQSKWVGDSTIAQYANGVFQEANIYAGDDLGWNLDPIYISTHPGGRAHTHHTQHTHTHSPTHTLPIPRTQYLQSLSHASSSILS